MGAAASRAPGDDGATVATSKKVREGRVDACRRVSLFVPHVLSGSILAWVMMPLVNRALAIRALPDRARSACTHVAGSLVVMLCWGSSS